MKVRRSAMQYKTYLGVFIHNEKCNRQKIVQVINLKERIEGNFMQDILISKTTTTIHMIFRTVILHHLKNKLNVQLVYSFPIKVYLEISLAVK